MSRGSGGAARAGSYSAFVQNSHIVKDAMLAAREALAIVRTAGPQRGNMLGDGCCYIVRQSDLTQDDRKQRAVDAFQAPDQVGLNLVADQSDRMPGTQRLGRNPHRGLEEVDRGGTP